MARSTLDGVRFIICTDGVSAAPAADVASAKLFKNLDHKKTSHQGLKCAACVRASITAVTQPTAPVMPAVYSQALVGRAPPAESTPVKARAPPRPHSCGPPTQI